MNQTYNWNPHNTYFPDFAEPRSAPWIYTGWIKNPPITSGKDRTIEKEITFEDYLELAIKSGREVDVYPEGAVTWRKV